jgi:hypothetical protein
MLGRLKIFICTALILITSLSASAEKIVDQIQDQESDLSKILKKSGSLVARESYELPDIATLDGEDITCEVMVLKSLINATKNSFFVGLVLKIKEKDSTQSAYIDHDEIKGLISSIELIKEKGLSIIDNPSAKNTKSNRISTEIHYRTKGGVSFTAFKSGGRLKYGIKVGTAAEWALFGEESVGTLKQNLLVAKSVVNEVK